MKINFEKLDNICDYIPVISTVSNLTNLFQRYVLLNLPGVKSSPIPKKDYYVHIQKKSNFRTVALLVPFIGNFIVAIYDHRQKAAAQKANELADKADFAEAIKTARGISNEQLKQMTLTNITNKMLTKIEELLQDTHSRGRSIASAGDLAPFIDPIKTRGFGLVL